MRVESIKPWVLLQDNTRIDMAFCGRERDTYLYADSDQLTTLKVEVKRNGRVKALFVDMAIDSDRYSSDGGKHLNSECAVGLDVEPAFEMYGYMADHLYSRHWCRPFFGSDVSKIPDDTQALLWRNEDGSFGYVIAVCDEDYKCTISGSAQGITLKLFSWYPGLDTCRSLACVFGEGSNPFELAQGCAEFGLELLGTGYRARTERRYPEVFEYLGWCSWDALQIRVNEDGLLEKCEEFRRKGIPVNWIIIDDMWAEVKGLNDLEYETFDEMVKKMHQSKLSSFEADPVRFPNGLKGCIEKIKNTYGLKVGMWHPTGGYWAGVDPESPLASEHRDLLITAIDGRLIHSPRLDKAFMFYDAFHTFLRACGTDFVKIDDQDFVGKSLKGMIPVGRAARNLHKAIESSVGSNFDCQLINCGGMALENMWNMPVSAVSRCSNDFLPENREWFTKHILQCSYNSVVQGSFLWCDWDMWWTDDGQAVKNSVLRAVSGGPIYVSDKLGRSISDIITPLVFSDGRILRCDRPAVPTKDCLVVNPETSGEPFKVWSRCGDNWIIAVFNLDRDNRRVEGSLSACDIDGLEGDEFVVYEHFSRHVDTMGRDGRYKFDLADQDDFRLFVIVPVRQGFAPIGLVDKYISPRAIVTAAGQNIELVEGGMFAFFSRSRVKNVSINNEPAEFDRDGDLYLIDCRTVKERVYLSIS